MTLENTSSEQSQDTTTSDLISVIPVVNDEGEHVAPGPAQQETSEQFEDRAKAPTAKPAQTPSEAEQLKADNERLRRLIATDPAKLNAYTQEAYGVQPPSPQQWQAPQQAPQYAPPAPQAPPAAPKSIEEEFAEKFPNEDYNPYDLRHSSFVQSFNLRPAMSFIDQQLAFEKEQSETAQRQQAEAHLDGLAGQVETIFTEKMPFFKDILESEKPTAKQTFLQDQTSKLFQQTLQGMFPPNQEVNGQPFNPLWVMPEAYHEVVNAIAPEVGRIAEELGLNKPAKKIPQAMINDQFVESPNAVPLQTNDFSRALQDNDMATLVNAIPVIK